MFCAYHICISYHLENQFHSYCFQFMLLENGHNCEINLLLVCLSIFNSERVHVHVCICMSRICVV